MQYAHVENSSITFRGALPKNWRNISGLNKSAGNDPFLKTLDWFPVNITPVTLGVGEVQTADQVIIQENSVDVVETKRNLTAQELSDQLVVSVLDGKIAIDALKEQKKALPILSEGFQVDANALSSEAMANTLFAFGGKTIVISSLTVSGTMINAVTIKKHHLSIGQSVLISGAIESEFNVLIVVINIVDDNLFQYEIIGMPSISATGALVANIVNHPWIDNLNNQVFWSFEKFEDIYKDTVKYLQDITVHARVLKDEVIAATTVAEVNAIDIATGWPETGLYPPQTLEL